MTTETAMLRYAAHLPLSGIGSTGQHPLTLGVLGLGLALLGIVFIPMLGFGDATYQGAKAQ